MISECCIASQVQFTPSLQRRHENDASYQSQNRGSYFEIRHRDALLISSERTRAAGRAGRIERSGNREMNFPSPAEKNSQELHRNTPAESSQTRQRPTFHSAGLASRDFTKRYYLEQKQKKQKTSGVQFSEAISQSLTLRVRQLSLYQFHHIPSFTNYSNSVSLSPALSSPSFAKLTPP